MDRGQTALALVCAFHADDYEAAGSVLSALTWDEMVMVCTHLGSVLADEWAYDCERLGVDWGEFIREAGLALAERELES